MRDGGNPCDMSLCKARNACTLPWHLSHTLSMLHFRNACIMREAQCLHIKAGKAFKPAQCNGSQCTASACFYCKRQELRDESLRQQD